MHGTIIDTISDQTFDPLVARAACHPVIVKSSQLRIIRRKPVDEPARADTGIQWLLLNTQRVNLCLKGTG